MVAAISISGLVKTFGQTRALDGLDLDVEVGEVHGFLGPNGSGKTTTIRVLLGLLRADAGAVELLAYGQELDLRTGTLSRRVRFRSRDGFVSTLVQRRFVSMDDARVAGLETTIVAVVSQRMLGSWIAFQAPDAIRTR